MKIFILFHGEYSDKRVFGVFDNASAAGAVKEKYPDDSGFSIEEYEVGKCVVSHVGMLKWQFEVDDKTDEIKQKWNTVLLENNDYAFAMKDNGAYFSDGVWYVDVVAINEDHAIKIMRDVLAQEKAKQAGI